MPSKQAVIDEDLPRRLGPVLKKLGWSIEDVRDIGLRGQVDPKIAAYAQPHKATIFTGDWGFAHIFQYPPHEYHGIIIINYPTTVSVATMLREVRKSLKQLSMKDIRGNLVILERGRIRIKHGK